MGKEAGYTITEVQPRRQFDGDWNNQPPHDPADPGWSPDAEAASSTKFNKGRSRSLNAPSGPPGLPTLQIQNGELHTLASQAEDALIQAGVPVYQRGSRLMRPVWIEVPASHDRMTLSAAVAEMTIPNMVDTLSAHARWEKFDARTKDWVRANPSKDVAAIMLARFGAWKVPTLAGVVTVPTMRPDGSILSAEGYDPQTRLFHVADANVQLHEAVGHPTKKDAQWALKILLALLVDFPLVNDVSKAVALSGMITPVVRGAMSASPMMIFRAPTPGSGKSYLVDVISAICSGRPCPVIAAGMTDEELEKRLVGLLLSGAPLISLDNVNGELGGDLLCQAIERPIVAVRELGKSTIIEIENKVTLLGTGNNMRVKGDMVRRTLPSDLDAGMERPETREFAGDPVASVLADRGLYVSACLIIVRAYLLAGKPGVLPRIGSFGAWSDLVRSSLVWLGCADAAKAMEAAREDDPELSEIIQVMSAWDRDVGDHRVTVAEVIRAAEEEVQEADSNGERSQYGGKLVTRNPELGEALRAIAGDRQGYNSRRLGKWLAAKAGRIVAISDGQLRRFRKEGLSSGNQQWSLERVGSDAAR